MLITRLDEVKKTDDFLSRFTVDPGPSLARSQQPAAVPASAASGPRAALGTHAGRLPADTRCTRRDDSRHDRRGRDASAKAPEGAAKGHGARAQRAPRRRAGRRAESVYDLPPIPGYRLEGVLGSGATGTVYNAIQRPSTGPSPSSSCTPSSAPTAARSHVCGARPG